MPACYDSEHQLWSLQRIAAVVDLVRSKDYDCFDIECAHNRIDLLADAVAQLLAVLKAEAE